MQQVRLCPIRGNSQGAIVTGPGPFAIFGLEQDGGLQDEQVQLGGVELQSVARYPERFFRATRKHEGSG